MIPSAAMALRFIRSGAWFGQDKQRYFIKATATPPAYMKRSGVAVLASNSQYISNQIGGLVTSNSVLFCLYYIKNAKKKDILDNRLNI